MLKEYYTLITGSSQGIGKALATECAKRGMNLLLVALPVPELKETAEELSHHYHVKTHYLEVDLIQTDGPKKVFDWCQENHFTVDILMNNAGVAGTAIFEISSLDYSDTRIQLNIRALVFLCRLFIPEMKKLEKAHILNVGSMSAYYAIPYKSIYSASKAFVVRFTMAVNEELKGSSIKMSVVNPNGVQTNVGTKSRIKAHGAKGKLTQMAVDKLAHITVNKMLKDKLVIIPGGINWFLLFLGNIFPTRIKQRILAREFKKEVESETILS